MRVPLIPQSQANSIIVIPGSKPPASRRHASNQAAAITAYVLPGDGSKASPYLGTISVAIKRNNRPLGMQLNGHEASIVDLEFLQTPAGSPIHILGSCDRDGVVFLWFLYVSADALGIEKQLCLLKKYSFFTLRKSTAAFYSRIRLAGTVEAGTMVLVPNDGANVRVVTFSCEPNQLENADKPLLLSPQQHQTNQPPRYEQIGLPASNVTATASKDLKQLPSSPEFSDRSLPTTKPLAPAVLAGTAVVGATAAAVGNTVVQDGSSTGDDDDAGIVDEHDKLVNDDDEHIAELEDADDLGELHVPDPPLDPALRTFSEATPRAYERSMTGPLHANEGEDETDLDGGSGSRTALNSTFPMSRAEGDQVDVEDDLAEAAAMAAGLPLTGVEGEEEEEKDDLRDSDEETEEWSDSEEEEVEGEEVEDEEEEEEDDFRDATGMVQEMRLEDDEREYIEDDDEEVDELEEEVEEFNDAFEHVRGTTTYGVEGQAGGMMVEGEGLARR